MVKIPFDRTVKGWLGLGPRSLGKPKKHYFSEEHPFKWANHIDITTYCLNNSCVYCTRYLRHYPESKRYDLSLDLVEQALIAYQGFPEYIGIIGGEPLIYKKFPELCKLLLKNNSRKKYGLWTSVNPETSRYRDIVRRTFGFVIFNEHNDYQREKCSHQPLTLAAKDMVTNVDLRRELYEQCWFRLKWCGTVNRQGAFHCEIAGGIADLIGRAGWPVEKGWWLRDWHEQIDLCELCGGAVPQERQLLCTRTEKISPSVLQILKDNGFVLGNYELVTEPYTVEYLMNHAGECPGAYRGDLNQGGESSTKIEWEKYL